ncbi:unnamed protein product [Closterium sp. NIES-54]
MYALSASAEGDCYLCVLPDPSIEAAALGASESALPGTAPDEALHTFTLDSGASRCFFRDNTTLTPLSAPVPVRLADPSGGPVLARSSIVLPCPAVPSSSLSGLHLPSFSMNLVSTAALQDVMVTTTTPGGQCVSICTCTHMGRHLATFTRRPGLNLYTLATKPSQVAASAQVSASGPVAPPCSCRLLSHQTLLWHHHLGHPSLPRLRGMHTRLLVSGLPRSLPPLPPSPALPCLLCVEGQQRAAPHSSSFPPTTAPFQTLHMDGILQSFTLLASPQKNGIAECRIGLVMEVAHTSMIHAAAPHFLWPFVVRYAAHQLNLWPRVSLPETSPTLRWTGEAGDALVFRHPTLRRVFPSQDVTFDESVPFYCLFPYRSAPPPPPSLFLAPGPPPSEGAESGGAAIVGAEPAGVEPGGAESEGVESGGAEPRGTPSSRAAGAGDSGAGDTGAGGAAVTAGTGVTGGAAAAGLGGAHTRGTGAAGAGSVGGDGARGAGAGDPAEPKGAGAGGTAAGGAGAGGARAGDTGAVDAGAGGTGTGGVGVGGAGAGDTGAVDVDAGGAVSVGTSAGGTVQPQPLFVPLLCQFLSLPSRRVPRPCPPPVPGTQAMALRPSSVPLRVPLPAPPESSLPAIPDPESDLTRAASPTVSHVLAPIVTGPALGSTTASALVDAVPPFGANIIGWHVDFQGEAAAGFSACLQGARDYELHSLEFSTTFLQGSLHEEIWLRRPPGFTRSFPVGTHWSLRWPDYGLRQAPRKWHDTLMTTLAALGFTPSTADPSLFLRTDTTLPSFYVLVYVDDLVFATADTKAHALVKLELQKRHTCTDLGELRSYLGLQITRDRARCTITLTQSHMVHHVLQRFAFQFSSPQPTPLSTGHSLSARPLDESVEPSGLYPELVSCLMYMMTCTQPDLATSGMGLVLGGRGPVVLTRHADASWVDDSAMQRSSQGYTFSLGSGSVSWRSTRSSSVLNSSCEAEIYAGAMAAQELRWLTYLLTDLGEQPRSPPVLYVDNKAMIALCQEHRLEHQTKHITLRYFLAQELQQRGQLRLAYVATRANTADIFTKALQPGDHQRFSTVLGLVPTLPH